jgi:hypothetical protein
MATARRTSGRRDQKLNAHCISPLQRKLLTPDKEEDGLSNAIFFVFLFRLFPISPFYRKCNLSPPLGTYKRGSRDHIEGGLRSKQTPVREHTSLTKNSNSYATKETWDPLPLSKACTPTTSTLV